MASTNQGDSAVERLDNAVAAFEQIMTGSEGQTVPVPGHQPQPTLAERVKQNLKPSTDAAAGFAAQASTSAAQAAASATASSTSASQASTSATSAAASAAQASQISGLSTVAEAIGLAALPLPDVWVPLSDSLRLITGYGREVKVGEDVVARMVNFSRNSTATYIGKDGQLKTAAVNEPRFEKEGLLIEGQSQNIIPTSNFPQNLAGWAAPNATGNRYSYVTAPDGTSTAVKVSFAGDGFNQIFPSLAVGTVYTFSFYAKNETATDVNAPIILGSGVVAGVVRIPANTAWTRYSVTRTFQAGDSTLRWYFSTKNVEVSLWGAQLEALPFASSYIPTNGAAVTRAADQAWLPAAGNRFIGGLYAAAFEFDLLGRVASGGSEFSRLVDFDNSDGSDRQHISLNYDGQLQGVMGTSFVAGVAGKLAGRAAMRMNNFTLNVMMDGVAGSSVTASGIGASLNNRIVLMNSNLFNLPSYGHIRNLRMWSKHPISNDQLRTAV